MGTSGHMRRCVTPLPPASLDPYAISWVGAWWAGATVDPPAVDSGDPVYNWRPIVGGLGLTIAVDPGGDAPVFDLSDPVLNNRPAVRFTGLSPMSAAVTTLGVSQPDSIVFIMRCPNPWDGIVARWFDNLDLGTDRHSFGGISGTGHVLQTSDALELNVLPSPTSDRQLVVAVFDGASSHIWRNGLADPALYNMGTGGLSGIRIGGDGGGSGFIGSIAFFGIYAGDVTADPAWPTFVAQAEADYGLVF